MSRPPVSVVMPFAGDADAARDALGSLLGLATEAGDELILSDNSGTVPGADGVTVVRATAEQSPAHARNVGAEHAATDWILFLDADCRPPADLLDAYFEQPIADQVGALAGEVVPAPGGPSLAARYGAARSFLSQQAHLQHPFRPRAVAANLLVRRAAFTAIGGFYEGVRAAEDTDFSWRLQAAGWRLELRAGAAVEHRYRAGLDDLRRQWRGYAAGRAWLARRYDGFVPEPAVRRGVRRLLSRGAGRTSSPPAPGMTGEARPQYRALDLLLAAEELAGLTLSNRPERRRSRAPVVLIADRFPVQGDPLAELAGTVEGARIEAAARPDVPDLALYRRLAVEYREDDGAAARLLGLLGLSVRHPLRAAADVLRRRPGEPPLRALRPSRAPARAGGPRPGPWRSGHAGRRAPDRAPGRARLMRAHIVDASAFTPAYDHAISAALARAGAQVELITSRFGYGGVPDPDGYVRRELFYRHEAGVAGSRLRRAAKLTQHVPDMLRYRRAAAAADVVHFQWLDVQWLDRHLLPARPTVLTAHDLLPREARPGQAAAQRRLYDSVDAVVVHSEYGRRELVERLKLPPDKVRVIHHGAFDHLAAQSEEPDELPAAEGPVTLFFGLLRPYKGLEVLLRAWRSVGLGELWIVGRPRMPLEPLRALASPSVRFFPRYVPDRELAAFFRRADVVALPYSRTERFDQSGVLATALAFGKATVVSDIGGLAEPGAARVVPPDDESALAGALTELLSDPAARADLEAAARAAAQGPYSWRDAAERTLALYRELTGATPESLE